MNGNTEIPYLLMMLRRRIWVLVLGLVLGVLLAILVGMGQDRYRAQAQLLIGAPATGNSDANSLERNLISQLSVLRSRETAAAVAETLPGRVTTDEVQQSTTVSEVAGSDVVMVQTLTASPSLSEAMADAYVEVYLERAARTAQSRIAPEVERLDARLAAVNRDITATNEQLKAAVAPYVRQSQNGQGSIPDPRTVAPEAAARQQLLLNEYDRLLGQRQELERNQQLQSRSTVLQEAAADSAPVSPDRRRQAAIVVIAGLVSVAVAVAIDAVSGRTLGDPEIEQALGTRLAARLRAERRLRRSPAALLDDDRSPTEDERLLWLKAERLCPDAGPAFVLVTGAAAGSGSSTTALALALQFAASGRTTVLVDTVGGAGSLSEVLPSRQWNLSTALKDSKTLERALTPHGDNLLVLAEDDRGELARSRAALDRLLPAVAAHSDVVVLDTKSGLGAAVGVVEDAHVVVLVIDAGQAKVRQLEELGVILSDVRPRLLPVVTHPSAKRRTTRKLTPRATDHSSGATWAPSAGTSSTRTATPTR